MMSLFNGLTRAYGTYRITGSNNGKQVGEAVTVSEEVTIDLWENHLAGGVGIGIVPIKDDSTCFFGAIDIDKYIDFNPLKLIKTIRKRKFPLVPCSSKSGGLHLFLFAKEAVFASIMREKLAVMAAALGISSSEIFPKQSKVLVSRGDIGSWINMPYYDKEKTLRFCYGDKGEKLDFSAFLTLAESLRMDIAKLNLEKGDSLGDGLDGPPCLQAMLENGVHEGERNDSLFNIAIYLKQALPERWSEKLNEVNAKHFFPPLSIGEIQSITKGIEGGSYMYGCNKPFLKSHCNKGACRTRKFGIGMTGEFPILTGLTKYDTTPPIWFIDVEDGGRMELTTEDLQSQARFQRRCMDSLNKIPPMIKTDQWQTLLQTLIEKVIIIEVPFEASAAGQLMHHLEVFCTAKAQARVKEELFIGKPWLDKGFHHFRLSDFLLYLERQRFHEFKTPKITSLIKDNGGKHDFTVIKNKGVNLWKVPEFEKRSEDPLKTPVGNMSDII
jgi:hypothetical protein